ncbi:DUF4148 domain-containing protein [Paraburkholderia sabiae]|uniref:DUF4148 domain-containing protein n=1 Tax=Paraburkholderia sabiae TaxID=273251 RepID=A0ABU9Q8M3_9BURK|nr:DUF4148 domain-containing protein [Paraburkholderia sabiae]WJZ78381.1 DUF4148 domain-containing protein [Paraburkholderia sabiae]CAD6507907.1 hypothetical protein LMG24235_00113 [Paraburkholderia sabiae]
MGFFLRFTSCVLFGTSCVASAYAQVSSGSTDPSAPRTRAQVVAELNEWFAAGFNPEEWAHYPDNAEAAALIVARRHGATGSATAVQQ